MTAKTILVVDDKADVRLSLRFLLSNHKYHVLEASGINEARTVLDQEQVDLVLLDMNYQLDTTSGDEGLSFLKSLTSDQPAVIAMTAWSSVTLAVQAMQYGASDFFAKPWDNTAVLEMVQKHLALSALNINNKEQENNELTSEVQWHCESMQKLQRQIARVAKTDASVLLRGENGTGKTSIAHYIHQVSGLSGPFVSVNVAAIPESLFESELFGHKKGAFTDAKENRVGRFEAADNGTLFLDEIGSLGLEQQAKLLRVLESSEYERVGDNQTKTANCRIICASNAEFDELIEQGKFRTDLYFRINTIELIIPPLKDRKDDILPLANYFANLHCKKYQLPIPSLSESAKQALLDYHWPGNVRELSHFMARAVLMCEDDVLQANDFGFKSKSRQEGQEISLMTLEDAERKLLNMAMMQSGNNVEEAALLLGISKSAIYRRLEKFKINSK
jgi:DNA-binding NtrC family response regulator